MSGGVDSSVAAALLKRDGFNVVGVYMKCWAEGKACTTVDDERSARLAANHLGIPFYSWNMINEYRQRVMGYMIDGYQKGITPNPDAVCNREIKFGLFFEKAMKLGADFVATGHYARLLHETRNMKHEAQLLAAEDIEKDQTYFLSLMKREVLSRVRFPIGDYTKREVREFARKFGLPNAQRKSSQGLCFVGKIDFSEFLKQYIKPRKGNIIDSSGKILGEHDGIMYYTIGQREGIGLSGGPYYVLGKDIVTNTLIVTKDERDLDTKEIFINNMNWLVALNAHAIEGEARVRYRQPLTKATLEKVDGATWKIIFDVAQRAVTPGQIAAFYQDGALVAAGIIQEKSAEPAIASVPSILATV